MKTFTIELSCALLFALLAPARPVLATSYTDGGTHTISGADTDVTINNGTTVNVVPGATVTGLSIDPSGHNAITVVDSASALNVSGGSITGGSGSHFGANGLLANNGSFSISGGTFAGGSSSGTTASEPGGDGARFDNYQSLSVSGGSFTGGSGFAGTEGYGVLIDGGGAPAVISSGTFSGAGGSLHLAGTANVNITGGQYDALMFSENSSVANVSNGSAFYSRWEFHENSVINVSGGQLHGTSLYLYDDSQALISNGQIGQINLQNSSIANISGGQLTDEISLMDTSVLNLTVGQTHFFIPSFYLAGSSVLNVFGTGLSLVNEGGNLYGLSGTLEDGTTLADGTSVEIFDNAIVNLKQTPEPSTTTLAGLACLCLGGWVWRRRAARTTCAPA